jgi:hypothetical protein
LLIKIVSRPLNPYRSIIERDPIEDHFTNKRLQKHMRHLGLVGVFSVHNMCRYISVQLQVPKLPDTQNKDPTSLARDEHKISNSEKEKRKRFRQKFIITMADT